MMIGFPMGRGEVGGRVGSFRVPFSPPQHKALNVQKVIGEVLSMHISLLHSCPTSGAQVDHEGRNKRTSLHEASDAGHSTIAEVLIKEGADPIPHDGTNSTPYDLAFHKGHKKVNVPVCLP